MKPVESFRGANGSLFCQIAINDGVSIVMHTQNRPHVCVITVTCNDAHHLGRFIPSLMASDYDNFSLLVVDNASDEAPGEYFDISEPAVSILALDENRGYAGACNAGITHALQKGADYVFLLNNDTTIASDAISALVTVAESDATVGIVGPLLLHMTPPDLIQEFGGEIDIRKAALFKYYENEKVTADLPLLQQVAFIGGGVSLIKAEVFTKVGLLDENYFLYFDEVDFDTRVAAQGYSLMVTSKAKVWHDTHYSRITKLRIFFSVRNRFHFVRKNNSLLQFLRFNWYFAFCVFPQMFAKLIRLRAFDVARATLFAWYYGVVNCMDLQKAKKVLQLR